MVSPSLPNVANIFHRNGGGGVGGISSTMEMWLVSGSQSCTILSFNEMEYK